MHTHKECVSLLNLINPAAKQQPPKRTSTEDVHRNGELGRPLGFLLHRLARNQKFGKKLRSQMYNVKCI
jgi:hypothetical protein